MKKYFLFIIVAIMVLAGCSGSDDTAAADGSETIVKEQAESNTGNNALMGYKTSLDTARSITSMAEESEARKNQAIQDLD